MIRHRSIAMIPAGTRVVSALLCVGISLCYWRRPDSCALITLCPAWAWFVVGAALLLLSWRRTDLRAIAAVAMLWFVFLLLFAEEPRSLLRGIGGHLLAGQRVAREQGGRLRVVSLNCAGGSEAAAEEAMRQEADVILLQESPPAERVRQLVEEVVGADAAVVCGLDCAIVVDGQAKEIPLPTEVSGFAVRARLTTSMGVEADVISLHLLPPVLSFNIFSPDCWRSQRANRTARREQIALLADELDESRRDLPLILGGDFNAPGGDGALRALPAPLRDAFREAGAGWQNTGTNDFPLLRFDQVWVSEHWRVNRLSVQKSEHSDHRMVICDLIRKTERGREGQAGRSGRTSPRD